MDNGNRTSWLRMERRTTARDEGGQSTEVWELVREVWGDARFLSGVEAIRANQEVGITQASVRVDWYDGEDVNTQWRLVDEDGRIYDVKGVQPDLLTRAHVDLRCTTGASNG